MKKCLALCLCLLLLMGIVGCDKQDTNEVIYELKNSYYAVNVIKLRGTGLHRNVESGFFSTIFRNNA